MDSFKIFTPTPMLGYGYDLDDFWNTVTTHKVAAIIIDSGSTDPGPYMLGSGKTLCSRESYIRDLTPVLEACAKYTIKLLVSSAGGAGTNDQVDFLIGIIQELTKAHGFYFKIATIKFDDARGFLKSKVIQGATRPCGPGPPLKEQDIDNATAIVAQMGAEPFLKVLQDNSVDIIVSGRSYDPAPFAALCTHYGVEESPAWHVGKIIECGGLCTVPKGRSILATMYKDSFDLTPVNPKERCTPVSVAAHTLYEKTRPDRLPGPGGVLHLDGASYTQLPDGVSVRVRGSLFVPTPVYQIKVEGAQLLGYRTTYIGGIKDPILIEGIDDFLNTVRITTKQAFPDLDSSGGPQLIFHIYGKNAVMGPLESSTQIPEEIGVLGEVVAQTQDHANAIAGFSRTVMLHGAYQGQLATAGNYASPLTPLEQPAGPVFKFSIYHLVDIEESTSLFPVQTFSVGDSSNRHNQVHPLTAPPTIKAKPLSKPSGLVTARAKRQSPKGACTIRDIASVVRSKNSGPFEITLDILFETKQDFDRVKDSNVLNVGTITRLYHLQDHEVLHWTFYEPALGWKCTFKRPWDQGSIGERDTFGAQQHAPLLKIQVPAAPMSGTKL